MLAPDFLYKLQEKDLEVTWLDPFIFRASNGVASVGVTADSQPVPVGRACILQHALATAFSGGASTTQNLTLDICQPVNIIPVVRLANQFFNENAGGVDIVANHASYCSWTGSIIMLPGQFLRTNGNFSSGVPVNSMDIFGWGLLIPLANIQR